MSGKKGMRSGLSRVLPVKFGVDFARTVDGRSLLGRAVRTRLQNLIDDLGGEGTLSHQQRSLCVRAVWLELVLQEEEMRIAEGAGTDPQLHTSLIGSLVSIYRLLGIKRVAREVRLADYLKKGESTTTTNG